MSLVIDLSCLTALGILAFQDFRQKQFSWLLIPVLLILFSVRGIQEIWAHELFSYFVTNSAFILLQLIAITVYFSIRNKKPINIVNTLLGIGDILFFFVICAAFAPVNFIHFYLLGLIFSLLTYLIYKSFKKNSNKEIPLAGLMALWLIGCFLYTLFTERSLYNDNSLINFYLE